MTAAAGRKVRLTGWALVARDAEMLRAADAGETAREIARRFGMTRRHVERRLAVAREADSDAARKAVTTAAAPDDEPHWVLWMDPLFPVNGFTPTSPCAHTGEIKRGAYDYCPSCHQSGMDHHPALQRDPRTDPPPEPMKQPPAAAPEPRATTRRARRAARRAAQSA